MSPVTCHLTTTLYIASAVMQHLQVMAKQTDTDNTLFTLKHKEFFFIKQKLNIRVALLFFDMVMMVLISNCLMAILENSWFFVPPFLRTTFSQFPYQLVGSDQ